MVTINLAKGENRKPEFKGMHFNLFVNFPLNRIEEQNNLITRKVTFVVSYIRLTNPLDCAKLVLCMLSYNS